MHPTDIKIILIAVTIYVLIGMYVTRMAWQIAEPDCREEELNYFGHIWFPYVFAIGMGSFWLPIMVLGYTYELAAKLVYFFDSKHP